MSAGLAFDVTENDDAAPRIGMAPLVDIVLLLICFYMLVMQSIQSHVDPSVRLPEMSNRQISPIEPAELTINLDAEGRLMLNGRAVASPDLGRLLKAERARTKGSGRPLGVVVRADARQRYDVLDSVLRECRESGLDAITIRAVEVRR